MSATTSPPALPLTMNLQYTKDLSFEVPAGAEIFTTLRSNPQISVNIDVQANRLQQDQPVFEIVLAIKAEATEPSTEAGVTGLGGSAAMAGTARSRARARASVRIMPPPCHALAPCETGQPALPEADPISPPWSPSGRCR